MKEFMKYSAEKGLRQSLQEEYEYNGEMKMKALAEPNEHEPKTLEQETKKAYALDGVELASPEERFLGTMIQQLCKVVHANALEKGFWERGCNDGERLALIHGEISEALQAFCHGNPQSEKVPNFSQAEEELADALIRLCDYAAGKGFNLGGAVLAKMRYNRKRPHLHGKVFG